MSWKLVLVIGLCAGVLFASVGSTSASTKSAVGSGKGAVRWDRAAALVGRVATVKGPVVGAFYASDSNGSPTFLNLGLDYPNPRRFTVLIWGRDRGKFRSPETMFRGKTICVRGLIRAYRGSTEVFASSPSQIAVA